MTRSISRRITRTPGDTTAQYRRNRSRAYVSVVATRVSVRTIDDRASTGSAHIVKAIFT
jgi:hypothetical protein